MLAPSQRHNKRSRSPASSEISDYSPAFDGFLKRRKRADLVDPFWSEQPHLDGQPSFHHPDDHHDVAESSSSPWTPQVGIERRRARQWQRLNAPLRSTSTTFSNNSQPPACPVQQSSSPVLMRLGNPQHEPAAYSHPRMSSSPVQHRPPGSSPFWETSEMPDEECMDPDDMRREWGEEYAAQNSLLHSLVGLTETVSIQRCKLISVTLASRKDFHYSYTRYYPALNP